MKDRSQWETEWLVVQPFADSSVTLCGETLLTEELSPGFVRQHSLRARLAITDWNALHDAVGSYADIEIDQRGDE